MRITIKADVTKEGDVENYVKQTIYHFGTVDVIASKQRVHNVNSNNIGIAQQD